MLRQTLSRFFTRLLILVILTMVMSADHRHAYALQSSPTQPALTAAIIEPDDHACPCAPNGQQSDHHDCNSCCSCDCHAPLAPHAFTLDYTPCITELVLTTPFRKMPEVYLAKFVPPQNLH